MYAYHKYFYIAQLSWKPCPRPASPGPAPPRPSPVTVKDFVLPNQIHRFGHRTNTKHVDTKSLSLLSVIYEGKRPTDTSMSLSCNRTPALERKPAITQPTGQRTPIPRQILMLVLVLVLRHEQTHDSTGDTNQEHPANPLPPSKPIFRRHTHTRGGADSDPDAGFDYCCTYLI